MTCSAAEHLKLTAVKANCRAKGKLFICFWCVSVIFHFSQLSGIFLAQKQHTWLQKLFVTSKNSCKEDLVERKKNQVDNSHLLHTSNVWRQNMLCLHPIRTCFFLTCTCLDATDGNTCGTILRCVFLKWPYQWLTLMLNLGCLCCYIPKWILRQGCKILIGFDVIQDDFRVCLPGEKTEEK